MWRYVSTAWVASRLRSAIGEGIKARMPQTNGLSYLDGRMWGVDSLPLLCRDVDSVDCGFLRYFGMDSYRGTQ